MRYVLSALEHVHCKISHIFVVGNFTYLFINSLTDFKFKIVRVQGIFYTCPSALECPSTGDKTVRFRRSF